MNAKVSQFQVNVTVEGDASEPEDESAPGVYGHDVTLARAVNLSKLTELEANTILQAVLDSFHDHQGIECLDDFSISTTFTDEAETSLDALTGDLRGDDREVGFVERVEHLGLVDGFDGETGANQPAPKG